MLKEELQRLSTEKRNQKTMQLDTLSINEILKIMNEEDQHVLSTVKDAIPDIEKAIELVVRQLNEGGRLIYIGAGTSGRIGIMDAVECIPTFSTTDEVIALMAGGTQAFVKAVEGAEDSLELAKEDLKSVQLTKNDVVMGIAASGRTPYVIGGLNYAKSIQVSTIALSCNKNAEISDLAEVSIEVDAGPEILSGSTRLKSGTAQKIILNMISTVSMIRIGKVYGNLMVDMKPSNDKLKEAGDIKVAIVMILTSCTKIEAENKLNKNQGFVRNSLED
ncbi:N-acetylmuramic acid 6-phosphate etherase [Breznakia pachnodae]|uniref:N-acetylmuramic acid 6-phosphate etherase n=1 Tax=Breznakia pachnodae TaxID=265178 RepID=A0ABU0E0W1_9FIRM|nr:N-acetylmuramic acid 6-phosphate etherase [Breznakia pachnodae]MDQ0360524.1 N-acetylmuramic acid 6-phosphate etherase [Breznakia pachnodae]